MRRLIMVVAAVAGVAVVRQWLLDRSERELGLSGDGEPTAARAAVDGEFRA